MSLIERLDADLKNAMKEKDEMKLSTLRMLRSAIKNQEIELRASKKELTEADVVAATKREIKKRKDAAEQYSTGGRPELATKEKQEAEILNQYLPAQLPAAEVEKVVKEVIAATGATSKKDFGKVMGATMKRLQGQTDGNEVKKVIETLLP